MSLLNNVSFWFKTFLLDKNTRFYKEIFIENYYEGYEKDLELCKLYHGHDAEDYETNLLKIKLKNGLIDQEKYDRALLEFNFDEWDDNDIEVETLKLDLKYGHIDNETYDKNLAALTHVSDSEDLKRELLKIDLKYNNISPEMYDRELTKVLYVDHPGTKLDEEFLRIDLKYNKITKTEYDKKIASLLHKPYVNIISSDYDPTQNINGLAVELDWNQEFIELLRTYGYSGKTDFQLVDKWFDDVCRSVGQKMEEESDFDERE